VAGQLGLLDDADHALELLLVQRELELALGHVDQHLAHLRVENAEPSDPELDKRGVSDYLRVNS